MGNNNSVESKDDKNQDGNKGNNEGQAENEENNQQQEEQQKQNDNDNKQPEKKPKLNELLGDPNSTAAVAAKRDAKFFGKKDDDKKDNKQGGLNKVQELSPPQDENEEDGETATCGICGEIFLKEDYYKLEICGHPFCVSCLYEYSKDLLEESLDRDDKKLKCPLPNCNCDISVKDLQIGLEVFGGKSSNNNDEIDDDLEPFALNPVVGRALRKSGYSPNERLPISLTASLEIMITQSENYVQCPNKLCQFVIERIPLSKNDPRRSQKVLDDKGKQLGPEALDHYLNHRFRCRQCDTIFCAQCKATPYHLGKTCRSYMQSFYSKKCRFCKEDVPDITQPFQPEGFKQSWLDKWRHKRAEAKRKKQERDLTQSKMIKLVAEREAQMEAAGEFYLCNDEDCHEKVKSACMHVLPCNHLCPGVKDEPYHCRCLREECSDNISGDVCGDDFCNICWVETLNAAPCVDLPCGHMFHYQCLVDKLKEGPTTDFLSYKFADCPLCKKEIEHPTLDFLLSPIRQQQEQVIKLARRRLQIEGMEDDEDLQEGHYYHNDPDGYALHVFAFYECFQCKKPYFGGKRECDPGNPDDDGQDENLQKKKELQRCAACSGLNATCGIHGTDFIEFKCRFCCSLATFFCGGKCHYCTPCHDIAGTLTNFSDWSTKWDCGKIKDCEGWEKCPLHVEHPKNGEEFALGCAACRADREKEIEERKKKKQNNNNNN